MKKSQILAAIALAMALGVVAPVVSAENASAVATPAGSEAAKLVDSEVAKMKDAFGKVNTYTAEGATKVNDGYDYYEDAAQVIDNAQKAISDSKKDEIVTLTGTKKAGSTDATAGYKAIDAAVEVGALTADEAAKITGTTGWGTDYDKTLELLNGVKTKLAAVKDTTGSDTDQETAAKAAIKVIDDAVKTASDHIDQDVVAAANAAADNVITPAINMVKALTNETVEAPKTATDLNAIIAKIEGKLPKMAAYRRVVAELAKSGLENLNTVNFSEAQIKQLIANMWAAYNGTTITTPSDQIVGDKNDGVNAPASGIAGTAEGTATTVSIVAGLATALTALGAGVVAYRSARRK